MSLVTPDWGPLNFSEPPECDFYGRHDVSNVAYWWGWTDAELEMNRRAEQIRGGRESYGDDYFPAQHSLNEGAGVKVTVRELQIKVAGGCAAGCW